MYNGFTAPAPPKPKMSVSQKRDKLANEFLKIIWNESDKDQSLTPALVFAALEQTKLHFTATMEMLPLKTYSELTRYYYGVDGRTTDEQMQRKRLWQKLKEVVNEKCKC